jgi:hypothetical protein
MDVHMKGSAPGPGGKPVSIEISMNSSMTADFGDSK